MKILYLHGYNDDEKRNIIPAVHHNLIVTVKDILKGVNIMKLTLPPTMQAHSDCIQALDTHAILTPDIAAKMKLLMQADEVKKIAQMSNELQVYDHFEYMMEKIDEIAAPNYIPTQDDILKTRVRTTGINEITYAYQNMHFTVVDMGGQRAERRKWMFFFEDVTAVIFVLALNEYDMPLKEEPTVNRMHESLDLFKNVINHKFLTDTAIILFLNKTDLFKEKIPRVDLKKCFPEYNGPQEWEPAMNFIAAKFKQFDMNTKRTIFVHPTCATDTNRIAFVLADVKLMLIRKVLQEIGIM
jgi:GTPase SAR1 family protein